MPVNAFITGSRLQLRLITGEDADGNPILSSRSYSSIRANATDDNVYQAGSTLANLQKFELGELRRINDYLLIEV